MQRMEWRVSGPPPPFALRQTIAFDVHLQDVEVVGEAVERARRSSLASPEHRRMPLLVSG